MTLRMRPAAIALTAMMLAVMTLTVSCSSEVEPSTEPTTEPAEAESDLARALAEYVANDSIPGLGYAVVDGEGVVESGGIGFADVENGVPATADTLFHAGSTHKAINALMVATLVDEGLLDWDTPIADLVLDHDIDESLTMRHLLTMTGGISADDEDTLPEAPGDGADLSEVVFAALEAGTPIAAPGEMFEYSNISASVAGYAAVLAADPDEVDVHEAYRRMIEDRVLLPLGMDDSFQLASDARASGLLARSYELDGDELVVLESEDIDDDLLAPSGSLKSTATDMARLLQMFLAGGRADDGTVVVSEDAIAEMWEPALEGYAMGWEVSSVDGVEVLSHEGAFDGFLSVIIVIPGADAAMVVLTNSEDASETLISAAPELLVESIG